MRKLAYIEVIKNIKPIVGADNIECAEILGWEVVVRKGEFNINDYVIYCEIDSILPEFRCFEFLRDKKFRIKTIKLKKQISQGIAFPLSILKEVDPSFDLSKLKVGQDLTEALKITKYDPEAALDSKVEQVKKPWLERKLSYLKWKLFGIKNIPRGSFPSDIPKTDETRVQNMGAALVKRVGELCYISEKLEGSSATFVYRKPANMFARWLNKDTFQICSRNITVYDSNNDFKNNNHYLKQIAEIYNIESGLKRLNRNLAIQGESLGGKIQGNIYKLSGYEFRIFLIYDLDKQKYLNYNEMVEVAAALNIPTVPILKTNVELVNDIKYYVELSKGKSKLNFNVLREGIVIRSMKDNFSFKSINPEYLLKQN